MLKKGNKISDANRFLANTLHEIRTPIQTIIGTTELISDTLLDKEQTEYVRQIQFSAEVLLDLANNILDFTKIQSNQFKLESMPFNIITVTEQVVDLVCIEAFNKGLEVVIDITPDMPEYLLGDPLRIQQVMLNLVKNAVKFTNSGYIHIELSYTEKNEVFFKITDSGIGIKEDKQKKLFTDYFQADISTYRKYGGTGLGLSISKNLITMMNGQIGVESNQFGGSVFYFTVPLPINTDSNFVPKAAYSKIAISDKNNRILIVDSSTLAVKSMTEKLNFFGIPKDNIESASSGEEALDKIEFNQKIGKTYTAIFINMKLSLMDGWQLASEIQNNKNIKKTFKLYLLVPEGQMRGEAKMKLLDWFDGYLYKPVKREKLFELLKETNEESLEIPEIQIDDCREEKTEITLETNVKLVANNLKILVAEDHPVNRKLIETFLKSFGAEVFSAEDGDEAVSKALENPDIAMIFMDIFMPKKSGVEATIILRNNGYKGIIVACTANNDSNDFEDYMKSGMNDIIVKPFKRDKISSLIEKWNKKFDEENPNLIETLKPINASKEMEIWDYKDFFITVGNDEDFAQNLIRKFILQTENLLNKIDKNFNNQEEIKKITHTIKGSSCAVCAFKLFEVAKNINDKLTKSNKNEKIDVSELHKKFEEFKKFSEQIFKKTKTKENKK